MARAVPNQFLRGTLLEHLSSCGSPKTDLFWILQYFEVCVFLSVQESTKVHSHHLVSWVFCPKVWHEKNKSCFALGSLLMYMGHLSPISGHW